MRKRYKRLKWAQYIVFVLSIISCLAPIIVTAFRVAPLVKTTESKLALGGVTLLFCGIVALIVFKSLVAKFIHMLPYSLTVLISVGVMLLLIVLLKKVIDDAIAILIVGIIGAAVGFVLELVSMLLKYKAEETKELYYGRVSDDV